MGNTGSHDSKQDNFQEQFWNNITQQAESCYRHSLLHQNISDRYRTEDQRLQQYVTAFSFLSLSSLSTHLVLRKFPSRPQRPLLLLGGSLFGSLAGVTEFYTFTDYGPAALSADHCKAAQTYYRLGSKFDLLGIEVKSNPLKPLSELVVDYNSLINQQTNLGRHFKVRGELFA